MKVSPTGILKWRILLPENIMWRHQIFMGQITSNWLHFWTAPHTVLLTKCAWFCRRLARDVTPRLQTPYDDQTRETPPTYVNIRAGGLSSNNGTLNRASTVPPQAPQQLQTQGPYADLLQEPDLRPAPPPYGRPLSASPIHGAEGMQYLV